MVSIRDDWEKPRSKGVHLTPDEKARLRIAYNSGRAIRDIARELQCSSRVVAKYYASFRAANPLSKNKSRVANPVARPITRALAEPRYVPGPRFYKSNFEL